MRIPLLLLFLVAVFVSYFCTGECKNTAYFSRSTVTSSSELSPQFSAAHASLSSSTAWCPQQNFTDNEYLQIDLGGTKVLKRIKTAGEASPAVNQTARNVTKFLIKVSADGVTYEDFDAFTQDDFTLEIRTQYLRIVPLDFVGFPCMRIEIYGCKAKKQKLCSVDNGGCLQQCIQHSKYCIFGKCFFSCSIDSLCTKWVECKCDPGYKLLKDKTNCADVNECATNSGGCDQICNNTKGSYECNCRSGFLLSSDKHKCNDIDECAVSNGGCSHGCQNLQGTYQCTCPKGFELDATKKNCTDVNECSTNNGGCDQICNNTKGSYECKCRSGFLLSSDKHKCNDIDECAVSNGGCSHGCQNLQGTYLCTCPKGFELDARKKNCTDTNECLLANGGCQTHCTNTNGSYYCSCLPGFELYDTLMCRDIDECSHNSDNCSRSSTDCQNFQGGYECKCKSGYKYIQGDKFNCELRSCPPLVEVAGTSVSPKDCLVVDARKVNDTCTSSCKEGYKLPDPNQPTLTCLDTGAWDKVVINCQRKSCPALPPIQDGLLIPAFCAVTGNFFNQSCQYSCNQGYSLNGISSRTCQANAEWDVKAIPKCDKVYPKPWISCPDDVIVDLAPNKNTYDITALLGQPQSNVQNIQLFPEEHRDSLVFPYGQTILTYVASNEVGTTANCTTNIIVQDKQPPSVVYCPDNIYQLIVGSTGSVTWKLPEFSDNVKVVKVTSTKNPGDTFQLGSTNVKYDSFDHRGNTVSCTFSVTLKAKKCEQPANPDNGVLNCQNNGQMMFCTTTCNPGKQPFQITFGSICSQSTLKWQPIPDCVDAALLPDSGVCPDGKIKQGTLASAANYVQYCVSCPHGMKYDNALKDCVVCPLGYYSQQESSPNCTKCPPQTSTKTNGSKACTDLCDKGKSSADGFDNPNHDACHLCSMGFYQDQYGATSCMQCPSGLTTIAKGSITRDDCGTIPSVSSFGPPSMAVNVSENGRAEFVCMGSGPPAPTFLVKKVKPVPDGFGGPLKVDEIKSGNVVTGIRYVILSTTEHDEGLYSCTVTNKFGSDTKYLNLYVHVHVDSGGNGSGSGAGQ
ncbi:uncharacterized protein [Porites lutea]|uniref:uncharacterized protein isoform X3 n=1 Tax=Porites lutea TaxID=51062 RepID=UPI003CC59719